MRKGKYAHSERREGEQGNNSPFEGGRPFQRVVDVALGVKVDEEGIGCGTSVDAGVVDLGVLMPRYRCWTVCAAVALGPQQRLRFVGGNRHGKASCDRGRPGLPIDLARRSARRRGGLGRGECRRCRGNTGIFYGQKSDACRFWPTTAPFGDAPGSTPSKAAGVASR
jgi:hypothetical protein